MSFCHGKYELFLYETISMKIYNKKKNNKIFTRLFLAFCSLKIIRGRTLFKLNIYDEQFGLFVGNSHMETLELPALRDILSGSVYIFNNQNLCFIKSIDWSEIITGK